MRSIALVLLLATLALPQIARSDARADCLDFLCFDEADDKALLWAEVVELEEETGLVRLQVSRQESRSTSRWLTLLPESGDEIVQQGWVQGTSVGDTYLILSTLFDYGDHLDVAMYPPLLVEGDALNCGAPVKQAVEVALDANCAESMDRQVQACTAQEPDETGCSTANGLGAGAVLLSLWMLAGARRTRSRRCERFRVQAD